MSCNTYNNFDEFLDGVKSHECDGRWENNDNPKRRTIGVKCSCGAEMKTSIRELTGGGSINDRWRTGAGRASIVRELNMDKSNEAYIPMESEVSKEKSNRNIITFCSDLDTNDIVYFQIPNDDNRPGLITAVQFRHGGCVCYEVTWSDKTVSWHRDHELTKDKPSSFE